MDIRISEYQVAGSARGGQVLMEQGFRYENDCLSKKDETTCIGCENFVVKLEKILDRMFRPKKTGRKHKKVLKSSRDRKK